MLITPGTYFDICKFGQEYYFREDRVRTQTQESRRIILKDYATKISNGIIIEIGVFGANLLALADICTKNNNNIIGIDPWEKIKSLNGVELAKLDPKIMQNNKDDLKIIRQNLFNIIDKYKLSNISIIHETCLDALNQFSDNSIDLIHLDGSHCFEGVYSELLNYYPKLKKNGILVGDDINWPCVSKAVAKWQKEFDIPVKIEGSINQFTIIKQ